MLKNRFKKIMVPIDGSQNSTRGLNEAISLARQCNSQIIGLYVISVSPAFQQEKFKTYRNYHIKVAKRVLYKAKISAAKHGIDLTEQLLYDNDLPRAIARYSKFKKCDLIVMGARGTGSPKAAWLGSVANGVINSSKIPVLVVK